MLQDPIFDDQASRPEKLQYHHTTVLGVNDCRTTMELKIGNSLSSEWIKFDEELNEAILCTLNISAGTCLGRKQRFFLFSSNLIS